MKISTKGRYGLRIMADIAGCEGETPVRIADIAARQGISVKYAEQITGALTKCGLLRSVRGSQGGYMLVRAPEQYTVGEILRNIEGDFAPAECVTDGAQCARAECCSTRDLWVGLYERVNAYLDGITLDRLVNPHGEFFEG